LNREEWSIYRKANGKCRGFSGCTSGSRLKPFYDRYCNSDYALASVLRQHTDQRFICWSYDIECQHSIHRASRFSEWFPDLVPVIKWMIGCIPKMHIGNHKDDCMYRYSFNYTDCVGCTCGEGIETTWAEANQTAGSTKKENRGHRRDTLDDFHSYWNWQKVVNMGKIIISKSHYVPC
jgi:hypothetical protein